MQVTGVQEEKKGGGDQVERGEWSHPCDFFVSCLGYAVGLGNIWRFPFLCYQHGGGSFLIPYLAMLFAAGLPIFFLEMALGQYGGIGPIQTFGRLAPILRGLGHAVVSVGMLFAFFYIVVVSWSMWYLLASFQPELQWSRCDNEFNDNACFTDDMVNTTVDGNLAPVSAVEQYWTNHVLGMQGRSWSNFGYPRWQSVLTLFLSWLLVATCLIKGIRSSGKVVYFTSIFPYILLLALAVRSLTLPGSLEGVEYLFTPNWESLVKTEVWTDAATQVIFSLGPGCGCVITLASYNRFDRNCCRDAVLVAIANSCTSILCGVVVFAVLGFMANEAQVEISQVVQGGPGLAFIVYPEVVTKMSAPNLWSALFFSMLITLALGSIFGAFETVISALSDQFPELRKRKSLLVMSISGLMFVLGLSFTCGGGIHMFTVFNAAAPSWNIILFTLLEVIVVGWVYKAETALDNLEEMGMKFGPIGRFYWVLCWKFLSPAVLTILLVLSWINLGSIHYGNDYTYPVGIQAMGALITAATVLWIPTYAIIEARRRSMTSDSPPTSVWRPSKRWGRKDVEYDACCADDGVA